jgi:hypothetical protein
MRIVTTASPVSGDAVRDMMEVLRLQVQYQNAAQAIQTAWHHMEQRKFAALKKSSQGQELSRQNSASIDMSDKTTTVVIEKTEDEENGDQSKKEN